jgi:hypothetical protein
MASGRSQWSFLCSNDASIVPTCGRVSAGVCFFPPPRLLREKPGRQQRERLMMMPATPCANFVIGQPGFALGSLQALFDAVLRLAHAGEFTKRRVVRGALAEAIIWSPGASMTRVLPITGGDPVRMPCSRLAGSCQESSPDCHAGVTCAALRLETDAITSRATNAGLASHVCQLVWWGLTPPPRRSDYGSNRPKTNAKSLPRGRAPQRRKSPSRGPIAVERPVAPFAARSRDNGSGA